MIEQAYEAYFRAAKREGGLMQQPESGARPEIIDGTTYIPLSNVNGLLAVYKVTPSGRLRRLRTEEWPRTLKHQFSSVQCRNEADLKVTMRETLRFFAESARDDRERERSKANQAAERERRNQQLLDAPLKQLRDAIESRILK